MLPASLVPKVISPKDSAAASGAAATAAAVVRGPLRAVALLKAVAPLLRLRLLPNKYPRVPLVQKPARNSIAGGLLLWSYAGLAYLQFFR
jgi:hypothetical protein